MFLSARDVKQLQCDGNSAVVQCYQQTPIVFEVHLIDSACYPHSPTRFRNILINSST